MKKVRYTKSNFNIATNLFFKNRWLSQKSDALIELLDFCQDDNSKELITHMIDRFFYLDYETLTCLLDRIKNYITIDSGFEDSMTQIVSLTHDYDADSGQRILDHIKHPVYQAGWRDFDTVTIFHKCINRLSRGKTQIILIDEFIGSGQTLLGRLDYLKKNSTLSYEVKCCFLAGMKPIVNKIRIEDGIDIFCATELDLGISGYYSGDELRRMEDLMLNLELRLAPWINSKELYNYSFGYNGAESLYSMEGCLGNTPNSTFPIFWWLLDYNSKKRNTLLTRYEKGF